MAFLEWDSSYETGITAIDEQHKVLIDIFNEFDALNLKNETYGENEEKIIKRMVEYIKCHFQYEEALFMNTDYPYKEAHIKEHELFVEKVRVLEEHLQNHYFTLSMEIFDFLRYWIIQHIKGTDMDFVPYVKDKE